MSPPRLNRRLTLEAPQRVPDASGGFQIVWVPLGVIWGDCRAGSVRERQEGGATVSSVNYTITVRNADIASPQRPHPDQRFRDGARVFSIHAVSESDMDGFYLQCHATEEVLA